MQSQPRPLFPVHAFARKLWPLLSLPSSPLSLFRVLPCGFCALPCRVEANTSARLTPSDLSSAKSTAATVEPTSDLLLQEICPLIFINLRGVPTDLCYGEDNLCGGNVKFSADFTNDDAGGNSRFLLYPYRTDATDQKGFKDGS